MRSYTKDTLKIFWQISRRYPVKFSVVVFFAILGASSMTYVSVIQKDLINAISNGADFERVKQLFFQIYFVLGIMWVSWRIAGYTNAPFQTAAKRDLYRKCFEYIHGHSVAFFNSSFIGSLVRKINKYDRAYEDITDQFYWSLIPTFFTLIIILVVLWRTNTSIALIFSLWTLAYLVFSYFFAIKRLKYDIAMNLKDSEATGFVADTLTNNSNLKMFASLGLEIQSFRKLSEEWRQALIKAWNIGITQEAIQGFAMIAIDGVIIFCSLWFWSQGKMNVGEIVMIQMFMGRVFDKLWEIGRNIRRIYQGMADANEMTEILLTPHEVQDERGASDLVCNLGLVEFQKVRFGYSESLGVLKNFSLIIKPKEKVAFVGPSGAGKSTIVKTLLRFVDIHSGQILIDSQNIARVTQESLRQAISMVPQEPLLFHRSLLENIRYGKPNASLSEVIQAAKQAYCHEFIIRLAEGYNTYVGERGIKLSGGERQRVAIARAILKNAPILVLDEATSSLDSESEQLIQKALENLMKNKTVIVIAHRLSTIMKMDRILVVEKGRITEEGKHEELLKISAGTYQKLWHIQAGGFGS